MRSPWLRGDVGLENFKRHPERVAKYDRHQVRIWSAEHRAYWRPKFQGYTGERLEAGTWPFAEAFHATNHCGPEKKIRYEIVREGDTGETARREADWHEDFGDVLWWKFPIMEAPWVGTPLDDSWPGYHTHWTPLPPLPRKPPRKKKAA